MRKNEQSKTKTGKAPSPFAPVKRDTKTHHRTGYHKPIKNPTINAAPDTHKVFCKRCFQQYNKGVCPMTGKPFKAIGCSV